MSNPARSPTKFKIVIGQPLSSEDSRDDGEAVIALYDFKWSDHSDDRKRIPRGLPYYWSDHNLRQNDWNQISNFVSKVLPNLADELNRIHNTTYSLQAWDIIAGAWLGRFSTVTFERLRQLQTATALGYELVIDAHEPSFESLIPLGTREASNFFFNEKWNQSFVTLLAGKIDGITVLNPIHDTPDNPFPEKSTSKPRTTRVGVRAKAFIVNSFLQATSGLSSRFWRKGSETYLLFQTSLSFFGLIGLILRLPGKVVVASSHTEFESVEYSSKARDWTIPITDSDLPFEKVVKELIPRLLPITFLEGFWKAQPNRDRYFPKSANVAFTATGHFASDSFNIWVAQRIDTGLRFVIGQHGGGAQPASNFSLDWERRICSQYLVNGDSSQFGSGVATAGQFWSRISRSKRFRANSPLLVTGLMPPYVYEMRSMPLGPENVQQIESELDFYSALSPRIRDKFRVRLYGANGHGWHQDQRWLSRFPSVKLESQHRAFSRAVRGSNLVVVSYHASTFAEFLAANIPVIGFWDPKLWSTDISAEDKLTKLRDVGVLHYSPDEAAEQVEQVWDGIADWWNSRAVQEAREEFCKSYAQRFRFPSSRLATLLTSQT